MSISGLIKWIRIKSSLIYLCVDCEKKKYRKNTRNENKNPNIEKKKSMRSCNREREREEI